MGTNPPQSEPNEDDLIRKAEICGERLHRARKWQRIVCIPSIMTERLFPGARDGVVDNGLPVTVGDGCLVKMGGSDGAISGGTLRTCAEACRLDTRQARFSRGVKD
jgi:hypothetical protein